MPKYRTKPCEIEAIQWTGHNASEIHEFTRGTALWANGLVWRMPGSEWRSSMLRISTLEGIMKADFGDYIIKGLRGEFYPCKPDVFEKKYELIDEDSFVSKKLITNLRNLLSKYQ